MITAFVLAFAGGYAIGRWRYRATRREREQFDAEWNRAMERKPKS